MKSLLTSTCQVNCKAGQKSQGKLLRDELWNGTKYLSLEQSVFGLSTLLQMNGMSAFALSLNSNNVPMCFKKDFSHMKMIFIK